MLIFIKGHTVKKFPMYFFSCVFIMCVHPVSADVYDDITKATGGTVRHLSRESMKTPAVSKQILSDVTRPAAQREVLPNFSSGRSKWSLQKLKLQVQSTGTIGAHAGWAYNKYSFEKMASSLSSDDVPGLLELFCTEEGSTVGVQFALASQCRAGLDGVLASVRDKTFHKHGASFVDTFAAEEIIKHISTFDRCDAATKEAAKQALMTLRTAK